MAAMASPQTAVTAATGFHRAKLLELRTYHENINCAQVHMCGLFYHSSPFGKLYAATAELSIDRAVGVMASYDVGHEYGHQAAPAQLRGGKGARAG